MVQPNSLLHESVAQMGGQQYLQLPPPEPEMYHCVHVIYLPALATYSVDDMVMLAFARLQLWGLSVNPRDNTTHP